MVNNHTLDLAQWRALVTLAETASLLRQQHKLSHGELKDDAIEDWGKHIWPSSAATECKRTKCRLSLDRDAGLRVASVVHCLFHLQCERLEY